jgi:hypothetical protein
MEEKGKRMREMIQFANRFNSRISSAIKTSRKKLRRHNPSQHLGLPPLDHFHGRNLRPKDRGIW